MQDYALNDECRSFFFSFFFLVFWNMSVSGCRIVDFRNGCARVKLGRFERDVKVFLVCFEARGARLRPQLGEELL